MLLCCAQSFCSAAEVVARTFEQSMHVCKQTVHAVFCQ